MSKKASMALGIVGQLVKAAAPAAGVAAACGVGAVAAQVGGALLKETVPQARTFAAGGPAQEAVVDLAGGVAIDAVALVGAGMLWGKQGAAQLAPYMLGGTALSALAPFVEPYVSQIVSGVVGAVTGAALPALGPGGYDRNVIDVRPGGVAGGMKDLF